jgi:hypothetical protein
VVRVKNPLCGICKKDIDLEELTMLEQAEALDGQYVHPECKSVVIDEAENNK